MEISEDEKFQVPAARLNARALCFSGKEIGKHRDETLALSLAPLAPDAHLFGIHRIVQELCRIGVNHDADGNVSLGQFLPQETHLRLLLGDATLYPERRITRWKWVRFIDLTIGPRRSLPVEQIDWLCYWRRDVINTETDKTPLEKLEKVAGQEEVSANADNFPVPRIEV